MTRGTILFMTANQADWQPIATTLDEFGFDLLETATVTSAAALLDESPVDCVVCDAGIDGPELISFVESVADLHGEIPLLLLGEPNDWESVVTAIERGATAHLADKDRDTIVTQIRRAVSRHAFESQRAVIADLQAAIRRVANGLLSAESRRELNARLYDALTSSGRYPIVYIGQYDADSGLLNHTHPLPGSLNPAEFDPLVAATDSGLVEHAHATQTIQVASGPVTTRGEPQTTHRIGSRRTNQENSLAALPMEYDENVRGMILLGTNRDQAFDTAEKNLLDEIRKLGGVGIALIESHPDQRDIDEFTENLLHELRNPLAIAKSHLALAREEDDPNAYRRVDSALDRIDRIIETVGTAQLDVIEETSSRDLGTTAEDGWASVKTDDAELKIENSRPLEADHDKLERLFANLFRNSVTHGGSDVTVRVGMTGTGFYVEDDGPGIPPEHWERVFDRGFSLGDGLGIGLDIVQRIVKAHGWEIEVQAGEHGGARFEITSVETEPWNWNDTTVR